MRLSSNQPTEAQLRQLEALVRYLGEDRVKLTFRHFCGNGDYAHPTKGQAQKVITSLAYLMADWPGSQLPPAQGRGLDRETDQSLGPNRRLAVKPRRKPG